MSIWATLFWLDDDAELGPPLYYAGSSGFPDDGARVGSVDVAAIPGFVEREGHPALDEDGARAWPWLRVVVNGDAVVLDRDQVAALSETLGEWLERA